MNIENNKDLQDLITEIQFSNIPYKSQILSDDNVLMLLLNEAKKAGREPNLRLYLSDLDKQSTEAETNSKAIEYAQKVRNKETFDKEYLSYNLQGLPSIKTIYKIDDKVEHLTQYADKNNTILNNKDIRDAFFLEILELLRQLDKNFARLVIEQIADYNTSLNIYKVFGNPDKDTSTIRTIRVTLNKYISDNYKPVRSTANSKKDNAITPTIDPNTLQKLIDRGLVDAFTTKWIGSNVLCAYFVDEYITNRIANHWQVGERIFQMKNLRQSYNNVPSDKLPKNYNLIEDLKKE